MSTNKTTRLQIRLTPEELRQIDLRVVGGDRSKWLRQLALGAPPVRSRVISRGPAWSIKFTSMEWVQANALAAVATQFGTLLKLCTKAPGRMSSELETEVRSVLGHVRNRLLP